MVTSRYMDGGLANETVEELLESRAPIDGTDLLSTGLEFVLPEGIAEDRRRNSRQMSDAQFYPPGYVQHSLDLASYQAVRLKSIPGVKGLWCTPELSPTVPTTEIDCELRKGESLHVDLCTRPRLDNDAAMYPSPIQHWAEYMMAWSESTEKGVGMEWMPPSPSTSAASEDSED